METMPAFLGELMPDETILWYGKPNSAKYFNRTDILMVPFSIIWFAFAIFWTIGASSAGFFGLFGLPFILVGLYVTVGRYIYKASKKRRTVYAITNKRVVTVVLNSNGERKKISCAGLRSIQNESFTNDRANMGSIIFGSVPGNVTYYLNTGMDFFLGGRYSDIVAFFDVDDVDRVYDIYKKAKYS